MYNPKSSNKFLLFFLVYSIVCPVMFSSIGKNHTEYLLLLNDVFSILIPVVLYFAVTKRKISEVIPLNKLSFKNAVYVILITILSWPLISLASSISSVYVSTAANDSIIKYVGGYSMLVSVVSLALMPAVFEEILCRGVLMSDYKSTSPVVMYVISGLFFGFIHMNFQQMSYAVVAGIIFAFFVHQTNSIFASMLSHFFINGLQVVLAKLLFSYGGFTITDVGSSSVTFESILSICVIAAIFSPLLVRAIKKFMIYNVENASEYMKNESGTNKKFIDIYFILAAAIFLLISSGMELLMKSAA